MTAANVPNYVEQGGSRTVIGGELDVISGGELNIESGGALKIAGTTVTATAAQLNGLSGGSLSADDVIIDSVNAISVRFGGIEALKFDDSSIAAATVAAADDVAGKSLFFRMQRGGTATGDNNGVAAGSLQLNLGAGSAAAGSGTTGGAGGSFSLIMGAGGNGSATGTGGAGAGISLSAGAGGGTSGAGTGGAGGDITLTPGIGGTTSGGTNGAHGYVKFGSANSFRANSTGNPAFGTGTGPANATGITAVSKWLTIKDNAGALFAIPCFGLSA